MYSASLNCTCYHVILPQSTYIRFTYVLCSREFEHLWVHVGHIGSERTCAQCGIRGMHNRSLTHKADTGRGRSDPYTAMCCLC